MAQDIHSDMPASAVHGAASTLTPNQAGMLAFLVTEVAFFSTLIMTYVFFLRQVTSSVPGPAEVFDLKLALIATACLLSSSVAIHLAEKALHAGNQKGFLDLWAVTIALGIAFLVCTAIEWHSLIVNHGLTISTNMFGTTYFTLVGFHALHVTIGVLVLSIVLGLGLRGHITARNVMAPQLTSWYWHFVDGVWIVVFTLVYLVGR
jgi:cytochrome c oxidase subunit III